MDGWDSARLRALLGRSETRAWRVEAIYGGGLVAARCPVDDSAAVLAWSRVPLEPIDRHALVVARSLPVAPGRWVLLGRPAVVGRERVAGFERLLRSLRAPRGEFWRIHGGVLARAARARAVGAPAPQLRAA